MEYEIFCKKCNEAAAEMDLEVVGFSRSDSRYIARLNNGYIITGNPVRPFIRVFFGKSPTCSTIMR